MSEVVCWRAELVVLLSVYQKESSFFVNDGIQTELHSKSFFGPGNVRSSLDAFCFWWISSAHPGHHEVGYVFGNRSIGTTPLLLLLQPLLLQTLHNRGPPCRRRHQPSIFLQNKKQSRPGRPGGVPKRLNVLRHMFVSPHATGTVYRTCF